MAWALAALPFIAVFAAYAVGSDLRLSVNPADKLLPAPSQILDTAQRLLTEGDRRSGRILFWHDTAASLRRLGLGVGIAAAMGLISGVHTTVYGEMRGKRLPLDVVPLPFTPANFKR